MRINYKFLVLQTAVLIFCMIAPATWVFAGKILRADKIRIFGCKNIKPFVIQREIPFSEGDYFNNDDITEAGRRIEKVPGVDFSDIRVSYVPQDSAIVVTVVITEKSTLHGYLLTNRGYEDLLSVGFKIKQHNLRGRSEKLYLSALFRGNTVLETGWENPWLGGPLHFGIGIMAFYHEYKYVYNDLGGLYNGAKIEKAGGSINLFRKLGGDQELSISGGFETVKSPVEGITANAGGTDSYIAASLTFKRDSRQSEAFPWDSDFIKARLTAVGPGDDDLKIIEGFVDARKYISLFSRHVTAFQVLYCAQDGNNIPAYRRKHIGGSRSLRGYGFGTFHGINSLVGTAEYRIPVNFSKAEPVEDLLLGISLHLFGEAGTAWERGEAVTRDIFYGSYGMGASLLTKNTTGIRFDYAWHPNSSGKWQIDAGLKF